MNKVDAMLTVVQAAMNFANDPRVNALYTLLAVNRNQLTWICQNQPDNGNVMALDAVRFAIGEGDKPAFMVQAGL